MDRKFSICYSRLHLFRVTFLGFNHPINVDSVYRFENSEQKRRRRR